MTIRVDGEAIPEEAIRHEYDRLVRFYSDYLSAEEIRQQADALRARARDQAIGAKLLIAEARRLNLVVPRDEVESRLRAMIRGAGGEEGFAALLARQGLTRAVVARSIEEGRRVDLLVDRLAAGVPDPTDEEIREHFETHRAEYRRPDKVQAQHILIRPDSDSPEDRSVARSRLEEIRKRVDDGAEFADEAAAHSQCPSGRKTGGSLGWISRGMMVPAFDEALVATHVGGMSGVVETPLGFHLIRKTAQEAGGDADLDDVRHKVREFLRHARRGEVLAEHVRELRAKAVIEET
jgi:parvulin-like peptidyl-prolyl isomerase